MSCRLRLLFGSTVAAALLGLAGPALAYVGPGAGFAFASSFLVIIAAFFLALLSLLTWPFRLVVKAIRRSRALGQAKVKRAVILGLDGMDPALVNRFIKEGRLPNLKRLAEEGTFKPLRSSYPSMSPVAWSTFQTGVNPGKHNIFDFLARDKATYLPRLSSADVGGPRRTLKVGKYRIPLGRPVVRLLRKSQPFWVVLSRAGVFCNILRVPITFPPEKFQGLSLSAMCVPDLQGSQGTFTYFTTNPAGDGKHTGGVRISVTREGNTIRSRFPGPPDGVLAEPKELSIPFVATLDGDGAAQLEFAGQKLTLKQGEYSPWVRLTFKASLGLKVHGLCRLLLTETSPHFSLYVTPIMVDPESPPFPISHPYSYALYLAKLFGPYATLGLAEDTWALNERVIDEQAYLQQVWEIHGEREKMFFNAVEKTRNGVVACVFDATDRIQHMFFRYLDEDHPANRDKDQLVHKDAIADLYQRMDELVGRTQAVLGPQTLFMIMSDHGFKPFKWGVNLNSWLLETGYLHLKEGCTISGEWFRDVDFSRTRAFALGLGGLYLNVKGREAKGIVEPGEEAEALCRELAGKLTGLVDPRRGEPAIDHVYLAREIYTGPYVGEAPDLLIGYALGYRASWDSVTGVVNNTVFDDNLKSWSGDHCIDPPKASGVLFCNRKIATPAPGIEDLAPTLLEQFGVAIPTYIDGKPLEIAE